MCSLFVGTGFPSHRLHGLTKSSKKTAAKELIEEETVLKISFDFKIWSPCYLFFANVPISKCNLKENIKLYIYFLYISLLWRQLVNNTFWIHHVHIWCLFAIYLFKKLGWANFPMPLQWSVVLRADTKIHLRQILLIATSHMRLQKKANHVNTTGNEGSFLHYNNWDPPLENLFCEGVHYVLLLPHANL